MKRKEKKESKAGARIISPIEAKTPKMRLIYGIMLAILIVAAALCLFPTLWVLLSAFKNIEEFVQIPPTIIPKSFEPHKLAEAWDKTDFGNSYLNTIYMGLGEIVFSITFNGLAGYVLSRLKPKGISLVFTVILWTMMMPSSVTMVPMFMTFIDFPLFHWNLTNTFWPFWLMAGANAFYIMLFKSFFDSIHMSYLESARIDGCSELGIFARIIVPMSKPIMVVVAIFVMNGTWGSFLWPFLLLNKESMLTTGIKIYKIRNIVSLDVYYMALIFVIIPPALTYIIFQKYFMEGLSLGGIKG
ncbi:MAG: carbohydrate ABC transporter permease [Clostridia bacterium]